MLSGVTTIQGVNANNTIQTVSYKDTGHLGGSASGGVQTQLLNTEADDEPSRRAVIAKEYRIQHKTKK